LLGFERVDIFNIADTSVTLMADYRYLILGIPTWDYGELQEDWEAQWDALDDIDFSGKTVALYGLGDQVGYPEWFQDALGFLWAKVINQGATTVGLALDDESEFQLSEERLRLWCQQILAEFGLQP